MSRMTILILTCSIFYVYFIECATILNNSYSLKIVELHTDSGVYEEDAKFGTIYIFKLSQDKSSFTMKFNYTVKEKLEDRQPIRVFVSSPDATVEHPLLFAIREQLGIISWQIPLDLNTVHEYRTAGRTLCPIWNHGSVYSESQNISLYVSTDSTEMANVSVALIHQPNFFIHLNKEYSFSTSPSDPIYFEGAVPDDMDFIRLTLSSENDYCSVVSIQPAECPVYDLDKHVKFVGSHLTMTRKSAFNIKGTDFKDRRFYVVVVVQLNDLECNKDSTVESSKMSEDYREKKFKLRVEQVLSTGKFLTAIFVVPGLVLALCVFICAIHICWKKPLDHQDQDTTGVQSISGQVEAQAGEPTNLPEITSEEQSKKTSIPYESYDEVDNICVFVSELGHNETEMVNLKNKGYFYITLTVVILYAMPVAKLVYNYEKLKESSGNLDVCYYNNLCMHSWANVADLNHLLSNILYVILGVTFIVIVLIRYKQCTLCRDEHVAHFEPWVFGGMGIALVGEGIMSGCYHVCPNKSNFLFDTSFMYLIAAICMMKTYQFRRPAMGISAYSFFLLFAFVLVFGLLGEIWKSILFWIAYFVIHICACFFSVASVYIKRQLTIDRKVFNRIYFTVKADWKCKASEVGARETPTSPQHTSEFQVEQEEQVGSKNLCQRHDPNNVVTRMVLLIVIFVLNFALALYGLVTQPDGFATHLLSVFIGNLILYISYYIIMKTRSNDIFCPSSHIFRHFTFYYASLALVFWIPAIYFFFLRSVTKWNVTPAESRALNQPCIFLDFYDAHDVWHFLSAGGLFFSFLMIVTMDDDIINTPQGRIEVF